MIQSAEFLIGKGINVVATNDTKGPAHTWSHLQTQLARLEDLPAMFKRATGLATLNGQISGGLMALDFEGASHGVECVFDQWLQKVKSESELLVEKLIYYTTVGGGYHVRFRCQDEVRPNQDLAKTKDGNLLIELRGEGGYALCPPSSGYRWAVGDWDSLSTITAAELNHLIDSCCQMDQADIQAKTNPEPITIQKSEEVDLRLRQSFNQSQEWRSLLEKYGWRKTKVGRDGIEHWVRPGKVGNDGPLPPGQ